MLTEEQVAFYNEHGYVHIPEVFTQEETDELEAELERLVADWATTDQGWTGPWRKQYMDEETEKASKLTAMHDLYFYSKAWSRAVTNPRLTGSMSQLIGPDVELHHSTMHIKPPEAGHPFPMHQDWAFYQHADGRYVDVLVHLDDTCHENGEIRFLSGSHKQGALEHVTQTEEGPCTPHLPTDQYGSTTRWPFQPSAETWCASAYIRSTVHTSTRRQRNGAWCALAIARPTTSRWEARARDGRA